MTAPMLARSAETARQRTHLPGGGYRRDHCRALAQRGSSIRAMVRIMGSKSNLLRLLAANGVAAAVGGVPCIVL